MINSARSDNAHEEVGALDMQGHAPSVWSLRPQLLWSSVHILFTNERCSSCESSSMTGTRVKKIAGERFADFMAKRQLILGIYADPHKKREFRCGTSADFCRVWFDRGAAGERDTDMNHVD